MQCHHRLPPVHRMGNHCVQWLLKTTAQSPAPGHQSPSYIPPHQSPGFSATETAFLWNYQTSHLRPEPVRMHKNRHFALP